jgi:hypothetical protein
MFELIFSGDLSGPHGVPVRLARDIGQKGQKPAKVMRRDDVNNLCKTSEKFSLPTVAQIQLPICHLPKPANFCEESLQEFPRKAFALSSGKDYNKFQSNIL